MQYLLNVNKITAKYHCQKNKVFLARINNVFVKKNGKESCSFPVQYQETWKKNQEIKLILPKAADRSMVIVILNPNGGDLQDLGKMKQICSQK